MSRTTTVPCHQLLQKLQSVQNAAARLVTGARRSDRITPVLRQLHWLPVRQRITFKTALQVTNVGMAWLRHTCRHTVNQRHHTVVGVACALLSPVNSLFVPRTRANYGDRSFAVHGPVVWNSLPADLRLQNISLPVFRKRLKMFLF